MEQEDRSMEGFLASHADYDNFRDFINHLLSTFMDNEARTICMQEVALQVQDRVLNSKTFPKIEKKPLGMTDSDQSGNGMIPAEGPFSIIKRAFTHAYVSNINMESLETLGDGVLNESVTMIIVANWPNLLLQPSQVANMKKFYTNNINIAGYAEKLGFVRWIVRHHDQGLDSKERADVFEAFIGAIVLIGEFYIGPQMGLAYARLFLDKFLATEKWYPELPEFYEAAENLWNDWGTSLPKGAKPIEESHSKRDEFGYWHYSLTVRDNSASKILAITSKIGVSSLTLSSVARSKKDAKRFVLIQLAKELNLSRNDINTERDKKRATNVELAAVITEIIKEGGTMNKMLFVPAKEMAGRRVFVFVKEKVKTIVGNKELFYERGIVSDHGATEVEALRGALGKLRRRELYKTVAGVEYEIWNPDEDVTKVDEDRSNVPRPGPGVPIRVVKGKEFNKGAGGYKPRNQDRDAKGDGEGRKQGNKQPGNRSNKPGGRGKGRGKGDKPPSNLPQRPPFE